MKIADYKPTEAQIEGIRIADAERKALVEKVVKKHADEKAARISAQKEKRTRKK